MCLEVVSEGTYKVKIGLHNLMLLYECKRPVKNTEEKMLNIMLEKLKGREAFYFVSKSFNLNQQKIQYFHFFCFVLFCFTVPKVIEVLMSYS